MRLVRTLAILICLPLTGWAQYANDWVVHGQQYVKISVAENAIYQVTHSDLVELGLPLSSIDPRMLRLYHRGQEQAILFHHLQVPANAEFDDGEYFEFYGSRNDGTLDAALYQPADSQPHNFHSLFSDTTAYFITWSPAAQQGKRMEFFDQVNSTNIPAETSQVAQRLSVMTAEYCGGPGSTRSVSQSFYSQGEGWTGETICVGPSCGPDFRDFSFQDLTGASGDMMPRLEVLLAGRDQVPHRVEVLAGPSTADLRHISTVIFEAFETKLVSQNLIPDDISPDGKIFVRVRAPGLTGIADRFSVSYIRFSFAQDFDLAATSGKVMSLHANAGNKSYVEFSNAPAASRLFDITDPANVVHVGTRTSGALLTAVVPNTSTSRTLLATSQSKPLMPEQLKKISFRNLSAPADFIIITHPVLRQPGGEYADPVAAYAGYRASPEGGGYDTLVVEVDDLFDQFNYGEKSPLAIIEFMRMKTAQGADYLFLVGKGRDLTSQLFRYDLPPGELPNLVTVGGFPPSDLIFTMDMGDGKYVPSAAVGRLPATTPAEVAAYLNKIRELESPDAATAWQKRVLHLSGGVQPNELTVFRHYMEGFEEIAEGKYLGADVKTLGKHSVSSVEFINISDEINAGVNVVTFFGHSSTNATDIDIGYVTDPILSYDNKGLYPLFLVNGCNAGDFYTPFHNFGEDWVLAPNKGARNFMANSSFGFDAMLKLYMDTFYESALGDSLLISQGVGDAQIEVARRLLANAEEPSVVSAQMQQMVLLGDPSAKLFNAPSPDLETSDANLHVTAWDNKPIHALSDSLRVAIIVDNKGIGNGQPLNVRLVHTRDDLIIERDSTFQPVLRRDTLIWTLRRGNGDFYGSNRIDVFLDAPDSIAELAEDNNTASWTSVINFNGTQNLQPPPFGIVDQPTVSLVFQDTDLMAGEKSYELEIDTTADFSTSFKQSFTLTAAVLARMEFPLLDNDSLVYYWRTRPTAAESTPWETTSFAYIANGGTGFAQLEYDQVASNLLQGLVTTAEGDAFEFEQTQITFAVRTFGSGNPSAQVNGSFLVNNAEYYQSPQGFNCRNNTINLVAFDRRSVVPYMGVPFTWQNSFGRSCGREPMIINSFTTTEVETGLDDDLFTYIDGVNEGDSVVLFTMGDAGFSDWSAAAKSKLGELGILASDIDLFTPGEPVIIIGKKGSAPGTAQVFRSGLPSPETQELQLSGGFTGRVPNGSVKSVTIGPSLNWKTVTTRTGQQEDGDVVRVDVYGLRTDGVQELLAADIGSNFSLASVDPSLYPRIRLQYATTDEATLTPAQLRRWIVGFDPAPDGLVVLRDPRQPLTVQEGQDVSLNLSFVNISSVSFTDSVWVSSRLFNQPGALLDDAVVRIAGPAPTDSTHFNIGFSTRSRRGLNDLRISVNTTSVPEQYLTNNSLTLPGHINVLKDNVDPLLDVVVDGRYLVNGDMVSSSPLIDIRLTDENLLLGSLDTTSLSIFLTYPCESANCVARRIYFSSQEVTWTTDPSTPDLHVAFRPAALSDGLYELRVQGMDASGNTSGAESYIIEFNVESDPIVGYAPPYPNPSSDGFFFDFQAAGSEPPCCMLLQIFTREGRIVSSFEEDAAPPLHTGLNRMKWSGLDDHGVAVCPGLYFYRMSVIVMGLTYTTTGKLMIQY
jgi:hypothetical protein